MFRLFLNTIFINSNPCFNHVFSIVPAQCFYILKVPPSFEFHCLFSFCAFRRFQEILKYCTNITECEIKTRKLK